MTARRRRPGTSSCRSPTRLPGRSVSWVDRPVTLPPGRPRLATRPLLIGSFMSAKAIGMLDVACLAALTLTIPAVTMRPRGEQMNNAAQARLAFVIFVVGVLLMSLFLLYLLWQQGPF